MPETRVLVVHLRQPRLANPKEVRSDPFWEFGSFGLTGCHSRNLMNPKKLSELNGGRLAFAQGGRLGMKLVYLSPPVKVTRHGSLGEATWEPNEMPFTYRAAPLLIDKHGETSFPLLKHFLQGTKRRGWLGRFSSRFRSRRSPLKSKVGEELVQVYENRRRSAASSSMSRSYTDALPYRPPAVDQDRESTYRRLLERARKRSAQGCKPRRKCG